MKITMYELLGLVKDGKAPKKIKFNDYEYLYHDKEHGYCRNDYDCTYICLDSEYYLFDILNDEVEILEEEKKIPLKVNKIIPSQNYVISDSKNNSIDERLEIIRKRLYANELYMLDIANTLNEIIDYLKSKGDE